jgi:Spy/CpxP family protein refolding chaperone
MNALALPAKTTSLRRPLRALVLALGVVSASGIALASWSDTSGVPSPPDAGVPHGRMLDGLLDEAAASPTQRAQAHQIFDAADAWLRQDRAEERADRERMARLFEQPTVDPAAVETLRGRIEQRHDAESRRATQALLDVGAVLNARQRQLLADQLTGQPHPFDNFRRPGAAPITHP